MAKSRSFRKPYFFSISTGRFNPHHPDKERYPNWTITLPASLHMVISAWTQKEATEANYSDLQGFIDALEVVKLDMRRQLDEKSLKLYPGEPKK